MNDANFFFHSLTPDSILTAIEALGIYPETGLLALNSYENRVYQFRCDQGQRYVVKFYRPNRWSEASLNDEHRFSLLLQEHDFPIAAPLVINGQSLHQHDGYYFALFPSIGGRSFEVDNLNQLEQVGRFIGRMHQFSRHITLEHRPTISIEEFGTDSLNWLQNNRAVPVHLETAFFTIMEQVLAQVNTLYKPNASDNIALHGDLHPSNILWTPDGPGFVDLDDCRTGPAIQDIWLLLNGDENEKLTQLDILAEAYEEFATFPTQQLQFIEPLRALRMMNYVAWLGKRWQDPAFQMNFPWFSDDKYWEQLILSFKEQLSLLQEPPMRLNSFNSF